MKKEIANLNLQLQASQRVTNGKTFGTDFTATFGMTIDYTKTSAVGALSVGQTSITVQDVTGLAVGQEVSIYDDVNIESVIISAIDTTNKVITVSPLVNTYKDKANVARTMAVLDTVNKCLKFGSWSTQTKQTASLNWLTTSTTAESVYPKVAIDKNGVAHVVFQSRLYNSTYYNIGYVTITNGTPSSITWLTTSTTAHSYYPTIAVDSNGKVHVTFYSRIYNANYWNIGYFNFTTVENGTLVLIIGSTVSILKNDIRFTVNNTSEVVAWVQRDELAGFTISAQLNGQSMTKTSVTGEDQFTATLSSVQPAEVKLTMTRASTSNDVKITKILGGVS